MPSISCHSYQERVADPWRSSPVNSDLTANDISIPDSPPQATNIQSGYFNYLWCLPGTNTYVFIDPLGNYGFNKGTNQPIFATGLEGAINATKNAEKVQAQSSSDPSTSSGDSWIDSQGTSLNFGIPIPQNIAGNSGIDQVQLYAENANHQHLTWGIYMSALTILRDFTTAYPLYADAMYFQISDGKWSTVGKGYMGIVPVGSTSCYLKGSEAENNGVPCAIPKDYPDN